MNRPTVCVVKVGGSLLDYEPLSDELRRWLDTDRQKYDARHYILIAGGGSWADAIRQADSKHPLGDEAAHWLCVQAMSTTAERLAGLKKGDRHPLRFSAPGISAAVREPVPVFHDFGVLRERLARPGQTIFDCRSFLREDEPQAPGTTLRCSWDVTSDSIAARLAIVLGAKELVLLKSAPPPADSWRDLAAVDYVDRFFERLVADLPAIRIVDLRDGRFPDTLALSRPTSFR